MAKESTSYYTIMSNCDNSALAPEWYITAIDSVAQAT